MEAGEPKRDVGERVLFRAQSEFQEIVLSQSLDDGGINLTLDGIWQFDAADEAVFHETLCDAALVMAPDPRRVLVLGGGDGLALRNVLRYPTVSRAVLVELDPVMIEMTRTVPELVELSNASLSDSRVSVLTRDALEYVHQTDEVFDVVICDFPACTHPSLEPLFAPSFFEAVRALTSPDGVVSIQVSQDPPGFWDVLGAVESAFAWTLPLLVELTRPGSADPGWADFIIASDRARRPMRAAAPGLSFFAPSRLPDLIIQNRGGPELITRVVAEPS